MEKTAKPAHYAPLSLYGLRQAALLTGVVLFSSVTISQAQTVPSGAQNDAIADVIAQSEGTENITYDANGRIVAQPVINPAVPAARPVADSAVPLS